MSSLTLADLSPEYAAQHPDCELQITRIPGTPTGSWEALVIDRQNHVLGFAAGRTERDAAKGAVANADENRNQRRRDFSVSVKCGRGHEMSIPMREEDRERRITYRCTFAGCSDTFPVGNRGDACPRRNETSLDPSSQD